MIIIHTTKIVGGLCMHAIKNNHMLVLVKAKQSYVRYVTLNLNV